MNGKTRSSPQARWMALAVFVGLPALFVVLTAMNLIAAAETGAVVEERRQQLAGFEARLAAPAADGRPFDTSPIYLQGQSQALASANLQQLLAAAVGSTSGRLVETVSVDEPAAADPQAIELTPVRLKASLETDNNGLLQLLYLIEGSVPLIDVDDLAVRSAVVDSTEAEAGQWLRVDLVVKGYWKAPKA